MKNWVRLEMADTSFFVNRSNVAGVMISKNTPTMLSILMVGDEHSTTFSFNTVQDRNNKLTEILGEEEEYDNLCGNQNSIGSE